MFGLGEGVGQVASLLSKGLDKIFPDPEQKARAQVALRDAEARGALDQLNAEMTVMLAEARSKDKWTSRARPSFLYVIYAMILASVPMGVLHAFEPATAMAIAAGMRAWLAAIPDALWTLFGAGYVGYVGGRSFDKKKLMESLAAMGRG